MAILKLAYGRGTGKPSNPNLTAVDLNQLARFDEHWRVCLAVLKRRVPLYRLP